MFWSFVLNWTTWVEEEEPNLSFNVSQISLDVVDPATKEIMVGEIKLLRSKRMVVSISCQDVYEELTVWVDLVATDINSSGHGISPVT